MTKLDSTLSVNDSPSESTTPECRSCGEPLDLHQPAADQPGHLLGVCAACDGWHIVVLGRTQDVKLVVPIPRADLIRTALEARSHERQRRGA